MLLLTLVLQDKDIKDILEKGGQTISLTIIPTFIFEHMIKWYVQVILSLLLNFQKSDQLVISPNNINNIMQEGTKNKANYQLF